MSTPRASPRPAYPPFASVLWRAVGRALGEPLLCTALGRALAPVYSSCYSAFTARVAEPSSSFLPPWVTRDDLWFAVALSSAITLTYVVYNGAFYICDTWKLCQRYKMPRRLAQEPSEELIATTLKKELFAHTVTGPLIMVMLAGPLFRHTGGGAAAAVLPIGIPSAWRMWATFTVEFLLNELMFYSGHRLLHTPALYAAIHKQHHGYKNTRSFAAEYAHVVEDVLTAYIPYLAGLVLMSAHYHIVFIWFLVRLTDTYEGHSGYCLRDSPLGWLGLSHWRAAVFHDHHHSVNLGNFGWELLDYTFGTMDHWLVGGGFEGYLKEDQRKKAS
jgi:sterol desaturase/sphingolipid hydroxylase (fatty acid hydroxylase superfamily)